MARFRQLFWVNLVLAVPVVGFSPMFADLLGYSLPDAAVVGWIAPPLLGTVMYAWAAARSSPEPSPRSDPVDRGMMLLISLGITVALLASWGLDPGGCSTMSSSSGGSSRC